MTNQEIASITRILNQAPHAPSWIVNMGPDPFDVVIDASMAGNQDLAERLLAEMGK